jgi:predicted nucleotidyltransferase
MGNTTRGFKRFGCRGPEMFSRSLRWPGVAAQRRGSRPLIESVAGGRMAAFRHNSRRRENVGTAARVDVVSVVNSESWMVCVFGRLPGTRLAHTCLQQTSPPEAMF